MSCGSTFGYKTRSGRLDGEKVRKWAVGIQPIFVWRCLRRAEIGAILNSTSKGDLFAKYFMAGLSTDAAQHIAPKAGLWL